MLPLSSQREVTSLGAPSGSFLEWEGERRIISPTITSLWGTDAMHTAKSFLKFVNALVFLVAGLAGLGFAAYGLSMLFHGHWALGLPSLVVGALLALNATSLGETVESWIDHLPHVGSGAETLARLLGTSLALVMLVPAFSGFVALVAGIGWAFGGDITKWGAFWPHPAESLGPLGMILGGAMLAAASVYIEVKVLRTMDHWLESRREVTEKFPRNEF